MVFSALKPVRARREEGGMREGGSVRECVRVSRSSPLMHRKANFKQETWAQFGSGAPWEPRRPFSSSSSSSSSFSPRLSHTLPRGGAVSPSQSTSPVCLSVCRGRVCPWTRTLVALSDWLFFRFSFRLYFGVCTSQRIRSRCSVWERVNRLVCGFRFLFFLVWFVYRLEVCNRLQPHATRRPQPAPL